MVEENSLAGSVKILVLVELTQAVRRVGILGERDVFVGSRSRCASRGSAQDSHPRASPRAAPAPIIVNKSGAMLLDAKASVAG